MHMMVLKFLSLFEFLYLTSFHANTTKITLGLNRVDGLAVFNNISGLQTEKIKKHFQNIFCRNNLSIIVNKMSFKNNEPPGRYAKPLRWFVQTFS